MSKRCDKRTEAAAPFFLLQNGRPGCQRHGLLCASSLCTSNSTASTKIGLETSSSLTGHNQRTPTEQLTAVGWTHTNSEGTDVNEIWSLPSGTHIPEGPKPHTQCRAHCSFLCSVQVLRAWFHLFGDSRPLLQIPTATTRRLNSSHTSLLTECSRIKVWSGLLASPLSPTPMLNYHLANIGRHGSINFFSPDSPFHLLVPF